MRRVEAHRQILLIKTPSLDWSLRVRGAELPYNACKRCPEDAEYVVTDHEINLFVSVACFAAAHRCPETV